MDGKLISILKKCVDGKRSAQLALYEMYAPRIYATCLRIIGDHAEAEEAMHDAFLKILEALPKQSEFRSFESWIHRVAVHTSIDIMRGKHMRYEPLPSELNEPEDDLTTYDEEAVKMSVERIRIACMMLPSGYRVVLSLHLFEGYDFEEIASILGIRVGTVRTQFLRGKRRLTALLKTLPDNIE